MKPTMSLTEIDKAAIKALWGKISKSADTIRTDALGRWVSRLSTFQVHDRGRLMTWFCFTVATRHTKGEILLVLNWMHIIYIIDTRPQGFGFVWRVIIHHQQPKEAERSRWPHNLSILLDNWSHGVIENLVSHGIGFVLRTSSKLNVIFTSTGCWASIRRPRSTFFHWADLSPNSGPVKAHAAKVMGGIA